MDYPKEKPTGFARLRNRLACLFQGHLDGGYRTRWPGYDSVVCPRCLLTYTEMHEGPPGEPFEDTIDRAAVPGRLDATRIIRVGGFITSLDFDDDGKLVDFQMEDWVGCKEEPGASPGRFGCSVIGGDEECLEDPDAMYEAIIRFWMRAFVRATSRDLKPDLRHQKPGLTHAWGLTRDTYLCGPNKDASYIPYRDGEQVPWAQIDCPHCCKILRERKTS